MEYTTEFDSNKLGKRIGQGGTAVVYDYGEGQIIKIFYSNFDENHVWTEWTCGKAVETTGLKIPRDIGLCKVKDSGIEGLDGRIALIQEKVSGVRVTEKLLQNADISVCRPLLEEAVAYQVHMHEIDAENLNIRNQTELLKLYISWAPGLTDSEKDFLKNLLDTLPVSHKVCHGDYHFDNVFVNEEGLTCIDWNDLSCGNPTADLARTILVFCYRDMPESIPPEVANMVIQFNEMMKELYPKLYVEQGGSYEHLDEWIAVVGAGRLFCETPKNREIVLKIVKDFLAERM